jgi:surface antigen
VAVVEQVNSDNTIVISESSYPDAGAPTFLTDSEPFRPTALVLISMFIASPGV